MKAQVSTELLVIIGLILLVFIPLLTLVYFKANESTQQIASYQTELAVFRIAYLANSVGALGTNTTVYTDIYIPQNVRAFTTKSTGGGGEITMVVDTQQGQSDVVEIVKYPIEGEIPVSGTQGGWTRIKITALNDNGGVRVKIEKA